jgi:AraC family transcriptional regulator, chitin signaling transcriptional activator
MKNRISIVLFLLSLCLYCQELPPIVKYPSTVYMAGNQNWMVSQDTKRYVYFANNEGLLEFNGTSWELYTSPNETIIRSVKAIGTKIYTGCYMEFGFWERGKNGKLKYSSISQNLKTKILEDEQFWNILQYDQFVIFQSLNRIFIYDTKLKSCKVIAPKNGIVKSFVTHNAVYFQSIYEGFFEIANGSAKLVSNQSLFKNSRIVNVFATNEGLLIQTQKNGLYQLTGNTISKFSTAIDAKLLTESVYSCQMLQDGNLALGTISNGIFILNPNGGLKYHISQNKGLSNNTALSLFEDIDKNLWIGLDNGINCINLQSPVQNFVDDTGILGTVYTSKLFKGKLYIGTNQGLFYKDYKSNQSFSFVLGTKGQVWSLFEHAGALFCGHDSGTFIIENATAKNIFATSGTWKFEPITNEPNLLLQGNYYGISVLMKVNGNWVFRNKISDFHYSSRYFEITKNSNLYVSHEYKGVFKLQLDDKFTQTKSVFTFKTPKKGKNASLTTFNNDIYYAYKEGIFKLNQRTNRFEKDKTLSSVFEKDEYTSGKLIADNSNKIWLFSKNYIHYFSLSSLNNQLKQNAIPIPASLTNSMLGFENINQISNSNYLIGTTDGYYVLNLNDLSFKNYNISLSNIAVNKLGAGTKNVSIQEKSDFDYDENNITFSYTVPEFNKYINPEYQYVLEGLQDEWSRWSAKSTINFKNLPSGNYTFRVRAKFANSNLENNIVYNFKILKPWYKTNFMLFIYFLFLLVLAHFIHKTYKTYYQKQREKLIEENNLLLEIKELENEQELMRMRNEQLSQDVDEKNRALAVSTMSLNSKNELLSFIKEDLKRNVTSDDKNIKSVITTINKNITEEDSWNTFKEAFDNADKDFLKKIKTAHQSLTPNDLRLCAYLRLNLSSKEIAPLLNISVRSVEIKRYRLRKKMQLSHEAGLVDYIMSV